MRCYPELAQQISVTECWTISAYRLSVKSQHQTSRLILFENRLRNSEDTVIGAAPPLVDHSKLRSCRRPSTSPWVFIRVSLLQQLLKHFRLSDGQNSYGPIQTKRRLFCRFPVIVWFSLFDDEIVVFLFFSGESPSWPPVTLKTSLYSPHDGFGD